MVLTIEKLEELASDKNLSKNELFDLVKVFTDNLAYQPKKIRVHLKRLATT